MSSLTLVYPVRDLDAAKALFAALLGADPTSDTPYYVGFTVDGQEIGLDPHGDLDAGPIAFRDADDIDATVDALVAAGGTVRRPAEDVGGGTRIATVQGPDGLVVGVRHFGG